MSIQTEISSLTAMYDASRRMSMLSFDYRAYDPDSGISNTIQGLKRDNFPTPAAGAILVPDPSNPGEQLQVWDSYTAAEVMAIAESTVVEQSLKERVIAGLRATLPQQDIPANIPAPMRPPATDAERRKVWMQQIDDSAAFVFGKWTRFQMEYEKREAAAQAYKNGGYQGVPDDWVKDFAEPAGLPYNIATDLILSQATKLRAAIKALGSQRMAKYRVLRAATIEEAQTEFTAIIDSIWDIDASLAA